MINVEICIGSACYVKGSSRIVEIMKQMVADHHWEDRVSLKGAFCMKACQAGMGLGVRVNGALLDGVTLENARSLVEAKVQELMV